MPNRFPDSKVCPFCGEARLGYEWHPMCQPIYWIVCLNCWACTTTKHRSREEAADAWNRGERQAGDPPELWEPGRRYIFRLGPTKTLRFTEPEASRWRRLLVWLRLAKPPADPAPLVLQVRQDGEHGKTCQWPPGFQFPDGPLGGHDD